MKLRPLLEERRRKVSEIAEQAKHTSFKIFFQSFLIYLVSFVISAAIIYTIFMEFRIQQILIETILTFFLTRIIAKKFISIIENIKEQKNVKEITY